MKTERAALSADHRYAAGVAASAVCLYFRFPLSPRMVEEMLAEGGIVVSHETLGLHPHRGATDYELQEAELARAVIRRAKSRVILCHSGKIGVESRVAICGLDEIDHVVTDTCLGEVFTLPRGQMHFAKRLVSAR